MREAAHIEAWAHSRIKESSFERHRSRGGVGVQESGRRGGTLYNT